MKGILGKKAGMSHMYADNGQAFPVTIIEVAPNTVMQVKSKEKDGYVAIKLGAFDKKETKSTKLEKGEAKKANTSPKYFQAEIRDMHGFNQGDIVKADLFKSGEFVDIIGYSKGKGFAGVIKRWNQSEGPYSHGSKFHRAPGSLGSISGQVFKSKKLPGQLGGESVTISNSLVIAVDLENNAIAVKGTVPGANGSYVVLRSALNKHKKAKAFALVDVQEELVKNQLLVEAKHVGAAVTSAMSITEMKEVITAATIKHEAELKERAELNDKAVHLGVVNPGKMSLEELKKAVMLAEQVEKERAEKAAAEAAEKAATEEENK